ncbi:MAG: hypothetical protein K2M76_07930, partial [Muribaculaceae bacterium]|nr:hypothetical protein [Muribaculaceae bacterium]
ALPSGAFAPYLIPMHKDPSTMRDFQTTPNGTSLFFHVIGRNHKIRNYQLFIEAEFNGYGARDFKLKNAYVMLNDWTVGLATSSFSDPAALPPTIDSQGPNARMSYTPVLVRWSHQFKHGISIGASLETPNCNADYTDGITGKVNQWTPDISAYIQYSWGAMQHVRLAGVFRNYPYRDLINGTNHEVLGWGFHLSAVARPIQALTLYGSINGGQGYASMACDWLMGNYDLVNRPGMPGRMYAPGAVSGFIAAQYHFRYDLSASAMLGGARYLPHHGAPDDEYRGGTYIAINAFYNLTPRIQFGAEFNLGRRRNMDNTTAWGRRIGMLAQFSF